MTMRHVLLTTVCLLLFLTGCAKMSVRHLNRQPWRVSTQQTLETKFWRFEFTTMPLENTYGVKGVAYPIDERVPDWAEKIDELWLAAYLNDSLGNVIAKDLRVFLPTSLDRSKGVPFEFVLAPDDIGRTTQLFITFGYRMVLSEAEATEEDKPRILFANEGALTRY